MQASMFMPSGKHADPDFPDSSRLQTVSSDSMLKKCVKTFAATQASDSSCPAPLESHWTSALLRFEIRVCVTYIHPISILYHPISLSCIRTTINSCHSLGFARFLFSLRRTMSFSPQLHLPILGALWGATCSATMCYSPQHLIHSNTF